MSTTIQTKNAVEELGFSMRQGVDWSNYVLYRPIYQQSFFTRIFDYHSQKPGVSWSVAHDIGAGHGIASSTIASRFDRVIVSDPNDGYNQIARKLLVEQCGFSDSKFVFFQEGAEKSSVESGSVDLITACECMQWTDTKAAVEEFARQLRPGGTLVMTYYTRPLLVGNERAQDIWKAIFEAYSKHATGDLLDRAFRILNNGFDAIALPETQWETVKRVYINASQGIASFKIDDRAGEDRVGKNEERIWVNGDPDWSDDQDIDWIKKYFATWVPVLPESEIQGLWDELERILDGSKVHIETPIAMVFATKKA
ncbi:S-adenosyl-L-methionine-dependent methyltransferase [Annulohypoxylon moriforme]|nr:S-adenosyl-L-methionine-dependent methyltransferase [Annulohypoxylon moriforme]